MPVELNPAQHRTPPSVCPHFPFLSVSAEVAILLRRPAQPLCTCASYPGLSNCTEAFWAFKLPIREKLRCEAAIIIVGTK